MSDPFAQAEGDNARGIARAALERVARDREARRDMQPMEAGGLFDEVRRVTQDLFSQEPER